jgi:hypothetical protein
MAFFRVRFFRGNCNDAVADLPTDDAGEGMHGSGGYYSIYY